MTSTLLACSLCAYLLYMPVIALFALLRLAVVIIVARRLMDGVRVGMVFGALELASYWLHGWSIRNGHPHEGHTMLRTIINLILLLYATGLPAAVMLRMLSRMACFRRGPVAIGWRRCFGVVPAWVLLFTAQIVWAEWRYGRF